MLPKTSPNYLQYKIHKRWLLSWILFIVIIRATTFKCFKMQMVVNLAPVSLSDKKVKFYTCPRLTFLQKNATENAYKSISEPLYFKIFWGGQGMPPDPLAARAFGAQNLPHLVLKSGYGPGFIVSAVLLISAGDQRLHFTDPAPVVQTLVSTIQRINIRETNCAIHQIEIYPAVSVMHVLNNWGLFVIVQVVE